MKQITFISALALICLVHTSIKAQTALPATGGEAEGNGGTVSYTIGQVVYSTIAGTSGNSLAQGVQQPYEISLVTGIAEIPGITLEISAYPNPAIDFLKLKIESDQIRDLHYQLIDNNGRLLISNKITSEETEINMSQFVPAEYYVRVLSNEKELKVFKIVKM